MTFSEMSIEQQEKLLKAYETATEFIASEFYFGNSMIGPDNKVVEVRCNKQFREWILADDEWSQVAPDWAP